LAAGINKDFNSIIEDLEIKNRYQVGDLKVRGIKIDSREISQGDVFVAITGTKIDGHKYLGDAVERGAAALIGSQPAENFPELSGPYLEVDDTRQALALMAAAWFDHPARKLIVIGVSGTDGKTTTVNLIYQILLAAGIKAGLISTVNAVIGDNVLDTGFHVTTPEAMDLQFYLSEMLKEGLTHVVLEATSHGLAQKRVAACEFDIGAITNITHEHLDYHGDYQGYLNAKAELFRLIQKSTRKPGSYQKISVLNLDDKSYPLLAKIIAETGIPEVSYGIGAEAQLRAGDIKSDPEGISFDLLGPDLTIPLRTNLIGDYNVSNCLAAAGVCLKGLGLDTEFVKQGIQNLPGIPGRMETINMGQEFLAVVDFAHTPNALRRAITSARKFTEKRVIAVFGSAGLRDREKRRLMTEISGELADLTILTAEDPRTESLDDILEEMADGIKSRGGVEGETFWRINDRGGAIRFALGLAGAGDIVLVCGKGHEQSMCFGMTEYPWDDRVALKSALAEYLGIEGPEMPYLPTS